MERDICIKELNKILDLAGKVDYLWSKNPRLEIEIYFSMPEQDESARISLGRYNKELSFSVGGTYFNSYIDFKRRGLNAEETYNLACRLMRNKGLKEGDIFGEFEQIIKEKLLQ